MLKKSGFIRYFGNNSAAGPEITYSKKKQRTDWCIRGLESSNCYVNFGVLRPITHLPRYFVLKIQIPRLPTESYGNGIISLNS